MVMEYVEGRSSMELIDDGGALKVRRALEIFVQVSAQSLQLSTLK